MDITSTTVCQILTRTSGFLATVSSHSLQPYRGCALGRSLCGVGCYVQHNPYVTRGRAWGSFVEARINAADAYRQQYESERAWAHRRHGRFGVFLSSSTEPFQPVERKLRITRGVLEAMVDRPPDFLILQSHSHHVADYLDLYPTLAARCDLRVHLSIESDRDALPGLPPSASPVEKRIAAARALRVAGLRVVVTVSPLLPIDDPPGFFRRLSEVADAVVIDHFIEGDGSPVRVAQHEDDGTSSRGSRTATLCASPSSSSPSSALGSRTRRTPLPVAMEQINPRSVTLAYRDEIVAVARQLGSGKVRAIFI